MPPYAREISCGVRLSSASNSRLHPRAADSRLRYHRPQTALSLRVSPHVNVRYIPRTGLVVSKRSFFTDGLPSVLVPPVLFTGLLLTLWTYKCIMTVLFQDKIIYMPYMPPFARSEKVDDYARICKPVNWEQRSIRSLDGTKLRICIGRLEREVTSNTTSPRRKEVVICYFHGNGSSIPPRLPLLSGVLKAIESRISELGTHPAHYTLIALSYRGYWTSSGRASQTGIEQDAESLLQWISTEYASKGTHADLVVWGQSIGAGVASTATASWLSNTNTNTNTNPKPEVRFPIKGMVLETPFTSIKGMLLALYPQKWLPYQYLWPFLWNHWDSELALKRIAGVKNPPQILLVPATRDEVVPPEEANKLEALCRELCLPIVRRDVIGALHTSATVRQEGQDIVANFVVDIVENGQPRP